MLFLAFMNIGGQELILLLLIVLVLFGAKKLPELARGMGQAIKEFQKAKDEFSDELHTAAKTDVAAKPDVRPAPAAVPRIEAGTDADRAVRSASDEPARPSEQA
jgi:sec-independent protein translocase protein TatA